MSQRDFIEAFMALTAGAVSPDCFRLWCAISMVASSLGRRVSAKTGKGHIYANLYTLLVGPPGAGKSIVETGKELISAVQEPSSKGKAFFVGSNSITAASLVDELAKAKQIRIQPSGPPFVSHCLNVYAEELQVLMPGYDTAIIGKLNEIYNNSPVPYSESRRTGSVRELTIENANLNILAGVQPAYFASTFPEEVWSTGFARRVIMVYSADQQLQSLWFNPVVDDQLRPWICQRLAQNSLLFGVCKWTPEAAERLDAWHLAGGPPVPTHSKLAQYLRSRTVNVIKLAMISSVSRGSDLVITLSDIDRAIGWLTDAERSMPDIFRAMIGKSDSQVIEEMHLYATQIWVKQGKKPVAGDRLMRFLLHRVPTEKAEKILLMAERSNMLQRLAGTDTFTPRPKAEHEEAE